ncbi:MAG: heavy metal translocating P-type ATPase [Sneathiella sp.]
MGEIALKTTEDQLPSREHDIGGDCCAGGAAALAEIGTQQENYRDFVDSDPAAFVAHDQDSNAMLYLLVENMHCANCIKNIEETLQSNPAVIDARVNFSTRRLFVRWHEDRAIAGDLLRPVISMGYPLTPYNPDLIQAASAAEDRQLLKALAVAGFAAANVMLLSVSVWAGFFSEDMGDATRSFLHWISAMIALPAVAYAGQPFFKSALGALKNGRLNMDVPISLAVLLASAMSLSETIQGGEHTYFDASVTLLFFLLIGRYLDRAARNKARSAAERLLLLKSVAATVINVDGTQQTIPADAVMPGHLVQITVGERLPVDGVVSSGRSELDISLVTGESLPVFVTTGDEVFAGTMNLQGPLEVTATKTGDNTLLGDIVRLMEAAEQGRAKYVRLADRIAEIYAPAVHILAALTFAGWWFFGANWQVALLQAVAVLIITCPCALGLAVPVVQVVASGRLLGKGILVKSADGLERLAQIDTVVFDKTGTLTEGRLELQNQSEISEEDLDLAASIARASHHPLALAISRHRQVTVKPFDVQELPGEGLKAVVDGTEIKLGNRIWTGAIASEGLEEAAGPELWLVVAGKEPVQFRFLDQVRPAARQTIQRLVRQGYGVEIISGDRIAVVEQIAGELGIENWKAQQKPEDKVARLEALREAGRKVVMIGDGLNDAPALAAAHVSISPSTAADISQTAADFVFQGRSLTAVFETIKVAKFAHRLVVQNFSLAFLYNAIAVPLAVAGFVTPLFAAIAMSASSLAVCLNSLRLRLERNGGTR